MDVNCREGVTFDVPEPRKDTTRKVGTDVDFCYVSKLKSSKDKSGMRAETVTVRQLFVSSLEEKRPLPRAGNTFAAPLFQRRYCWDEGLWTTLWDDILSSNAQENASVCHSLGRMLVSTIDESPGNYLCIDGQQRITTISLVLAALLERLQSLLRAHNISQESAERLEWSAVAMREDVIALLLSESDECIGSVDNANCRFIPTHFDRNAFVSTVYSACFGSATMTSLTLNDQDDLAEESPVSLCASFFKGKALHLDTIGLLQEIVIKLLDGMSFVVLISEAQAGNQRFESFWRASVISRKFFGLQTVRSGEGMTAVDLIRNLVLSCLTPARVAEVYKKLWLQLEVCIVKNLCGSTRALSNGRASAMIHSKWFTEFTEDNPWMKREDATAMLTQADGLDMETETFPLFAIAYGRRLGDLLEECGGDKDAAVMRCISELIAHASQ